MDFRHRHRKAARLARKHGFAEAMTRHAAVFYPRGDTLIVGFDNMKSREQPAPAFPWGYAAIAKAGHSHLGIMMSRRNDWFRHRDVVDFFDHLKSSGFFKQFHRVVFFGASMGGYAALCYCAASPGADVVTFSPQTSLDPATVPFETRYPKGLARGDWECGVTDGAVGARTARQVMVFADPYHSIDVAHIARLPGRNLRWMRCPNFGHSPARVMKHMTVLGPSLRAAWKGQLSPSAFAKMQRAHRFTAPGLTREVLLRGLETGHAGLVLSTIRSLEAAHPTWSFPRIAGMAQEQLALAGRAAA